MSDKQPSFSERRERLQSVANDLLRISDLIADEVMHMEAAEKRFADRRRNAKAGR